MIGAKLTALPCAIVSYQPVWGPGGVDLNYMLTAHAATLSGSHLSAYS